MVICIGEVLFDLISNEPGVPLESVTAWTPYPGGAPANVACGLSKLGIQTAFIGSIGQDAMGAELTETLRSHQLNLSGLQLIPGYPTRSVLVTRSAQGDRSFAAFGGDRSTDSFADTQLSADNLPKDLFKPGTYLVTGTLGLATPDSAGAIHYAIDLTRQQGGTIVTDLNWRSVFWPDPDFAPSLILDLVAKTDVLKLTDEEAQRFFQTEDPQVIQTRHPHLQVVLLTQGEKGCKYWIAGNQGEMPAFTMDVEDTTGAGDAFLAGFLSQYIENPQAFTDPKLAEFSIRYASAAGALTTLKRGAIVALPTPEELAAFLHFQQIT
jgi:fructokinase